MRHWSGQAAYSLLKGSQFNYWTVTGERQIRINPSGQHKSHYMCKCACGKEKLVYSNSLVSGKSKSCGCCSPRRKPFGFAHINTVYSTYRSGAKRYNRDFSLSLEEFSKLLHQDCFYCGAKPSNFTYKTRLNGCIPYNGIDRVNNDLGYTLNNVVSSCKNCNLAKRALNQDAFLDMIKHIYERHFK